MELPVNANIICTDGHFGQSIRVVLNPCDNTASHIVVKQARKPMEYLVEIDYITESDDHSIILRVSKAEVMAMRVFNDVQYIKAGGNDQPGSEHALGRSGHSLVLPYTIPHPDHQHPVEYERVPHGELAISRGHSVEAKDGYVGKVDEFLVNPKDHHISHIIMRTGHFWDERDVTIPITAIDHIDAGKVLLSLNKSAIQQLPAIPVKRWWD